MNSMVVLINPPTPEEEEAAKNYKGPFLFKCPMPKCGCSFATKIDLYRHHLPYCKEKTWRKSSYKDGSDYSQIGFHTELVRLCRAKQGVIRVGKHEYWLGLKKKYIKRRRI